MTTRRTVPVVLAVAAMMTVLAARMARRTGASPAEARVPRPGDTLLPRADLQYDRARTLAAPPAEVWPWIAQLGQDRAGFYSFQALENLTGCRITGADRVHPEWQHVEPGDRFRLHPDVALRVAAVEPGAHLVVTSRGGDAPGRTDTAMTWLFHLAPVALPDGTPGTRLHLRERYETGGLVERAAVRLTGVVSAVMTWRMLGRLAVLVTGAPAHPSGWSGPGVPLGSRRSARCLAGWSAQRR